MEKKKKEKNEYEKETTTAMIAKHQTLIVVLPIKHKMV